MLTKKFPLIKSMANNIKIHPEPGFKLQFDGCSKNNPGLAGAGAVIYYNDGEVWSSNIFVGEKTTNNQAEYAGLILGLNRAIDMNITSLYVEGDSLLVINQLKGNYKCNSPNLFELYEKAKSLIQKFDTINFNHILRNHNKRADQLSNIAVDDYIKSLSLHKKVSIQ